MWLSWLVKWAQRLPFFYFTHIQKMGAGRQALERGGEELRVWGPRSGEGYQKGKCCSSKRLHLIAPCSPESLSSMLGLLICPSPRPVMASVTVILFF